MNFAGNLMAADKQRERIEREQDLKAQEFIIRSNLALIPQSELVVLPQGAHFIPYQFPKELAGLVRAFLARHAL